MSRREMPAFAVPVTREHIERLVQAGIDLLDALDAPHEDMEPDDGEDADVDDHDRFATRHAHRGMIGSDKLRRQWRKRLRRRKRE